MKRLLLVASLLACACDVALDLGTADAGTSASSRDSGASAAPDSAIAPGVDAGGALDASIAEDAGIARDASAEPDAASAGRDASAPSVSDASSGSTVSYTVDSTTNIANPERGFYHHMETQSSGYEALDEASLEAFRTQEQVSLILRMWYLKDYVATDFDQAFLNKISSDFDQVRAAGLKAVVRFAYSDDESDSPRDATKAQVLRHINQLTPILSANSDIIATVQAGFIGVWGEWYYTDNFGDQGNVSASQWTDRQDVVSALLAAVPSRTVLLRTPHFKETFYGASPLSASEAFSGSDKSRVGHHNDCFLASADDEGTYTDVTTDKAYLAQDTLYVPIGGETCAVSSYSVWTNANNDMTNLHWSFLNTDYKQDVLTTWGTSIDIAKRSLGYRLGLVQGTYSSSVASGGEMNVSLTIRNDGYAPPFNPRPMQLILRDASTGSVHVVALAGDWRLWVPGADAILSQAVSVAGIPAGTYELLFNLPDPSPALSTRPEYSVQLANMGTWEAVTGYNQLNASVTITP